MLNSHEVNCLGNIINHTWGKSSLNQDGSNSVTCRLKDDILSIQFQTVVYFASENSLREQTPRLANESIQVLSNALTSLKAKFKDSSGTSLSISEVSNNDDIELISSTVNNPRKIAYYRRRINFKIGN